MEENREHWELVSMATIGSVEAALFRSEDGRRWTVLCGPGAILRAQVAPTLGTELDLATICGTDGIEQLAGWPEDWTKGEERIVDLYQLDVYGDDRP